MNSKLMLLAATLLGFVAGCRRSNEDVGDNEKVCRTREAEDIRAIVAEFEGATDFSAIRSDLHPVALFQEELQKTPNALYYCKLPRWNWDAHYDHSGQLWIIFDEHFLPNLIQVRLQCDCQAIAPFREEGATSTDQFVVIFKLESTLKPSLMIKGEPREEDFVEVFLDSGAPLIVVGELVGIRKLPSD